RRAVAGRGGRRAGRRGDGSGRPRGRRGRPGRRGGRRGCGGGGGAHRPTDGGGGDRPPGRESGIGSPLRSCIGCRRVRTQGELVRYVRTPEGTLAEGRTLGGRGAWLCRESAACVEAAVRHRAFGRALRGDIRPEDKIGRDTSE